MTRCSIVIPTQESGVQLSGARFWDTVPNTAHFSAKPRGTPEYFREVNGKRYAKRWLTDFADFPRWKGARILDLGCGIGSDAVMFAKAGADVTAVDFSAVSLSIAWRQAETESVKVTFVLADIERLPAFVHPESYDLIWAWQTLHHLMFPRRTLGMLSELYGGASTLLRAAVHNCNSHRLWSGQWKPKYPIAHSWTRQEIPAVFAPWAVRKIETCYFGPHPTLAQLLPKRFGWYHLVEAQHA